ncbi:unnamed protein product [Caenorhabditis sp. 36 PRJEB53466]|nr:unnamed protein product [Caenorhabditis sp. 36 PRJEB53466]
MQEEHFLGLFTLFSGFVGFVTNWSVVFFFRSVPSLRSSFGVLSAHAALVSAVYCSIALFWISPIMLLNVEWLRNNSYLAGFVLYLCYDLETETHLLICINRITSTFIFLAILWVVCLLISIIVFPLSGCQMYYDAEIMTLIYTRTPSCQNLTLIADFGLHMCVLTAMIVLNSITFYQFRRKNRAMFNSLNHASSLRKAKSERNFLRQTFYQESAYVVALLTYFLLGTVLEAKWLRFVVILLPWYFVHAYQAMVTILCNPELKKICIRKWRLCDAKGLVQFSHFLGLAAMTVYEVSNQSHLLIALNRFCAVFMRSHYEKLFSEFGTKVLRNIIWIISTIMCVILYEIIGCHFEYDDVSWSLAFVATPECANLTWYSDFTFNTSLVVLTLLINLLTAYKAGRDSRMLMNAAGMKMSKRQRQRELNFVKQTFSQGTTIFAGQITYYVIAPLFTDQILLFFIGTLWAYMHAAEGGIILASNEEMRTFAFKKRKKSNTSVFVSSVSIG